LFFIFTSLDILWVLGNALSTYTTYTYYLLTYLSIIKIKRVRCKKQSIQFFGQQSKKRFDQVLKDFDCSFSPSFVNQFKGFPELNSLEQSELEVGSHKPGHDLRLDEINIKNSNNSNFPHVINSFNNQTINQLIPDSIHFIQIIQLK
jgi:hypothetical protein